MMMSDEKKADEVSSETENTAADEKKHDNQAVQNSVKSAEEKNTGKTEPVEMQKTETLKVQASDNTERQSQPDQSGTQETFRSAVHQEKETKQNSSGRDIPPADHISASKKTEKKHHGIWKTALMYVLVFLVAGCGAFAGSYAAEHVYHEKMEKEAVKQFGNFGNMMPFGGDNSESESSGPALGIVIQQTDDGIEIVGFAKNGNAEKAGLKTGDIIEKVDGKSYDSVSEITSYISSKSVGDNVKVTVSRNGEEKTYSVRLVKKDLSSYSMPSVPSDNNSDSDDQNQPKALPGTDGGNSQLQG